MAWGIIMTVITLAGMLALVISSLNEKEVCPSVKETDPVLSAKIARRLMA
ncbi:hypothetical protein [Petrachloros mirabilis]